METTFAHAATLRMEPGSDSRAPGGAVASPTMASGPVDPGDER